MASKVPAVLRSSPSAKISFFEIFPTGFPVGFFIAFYQQGAALPIFSGGG